MNGGSTLTLHRSALGGYALVTATGTVDIHTHTLLAECLEQASTATGLAVIVDMAGVEFCDSSGLNAFARAYNRAHGRGVSLVAAGLQERVRRVFTVTGLDRGVHLQPDVDTAVRWLDTGSRAG
ncbi:MULTISPECIES: STAS domain-containing protein [Actinomadura]|uniref:STAS domain-containing protein n=1 Tax=Actinomadura TaxID=1988 RepID=UPI001564174F|nr:MULTISPECIES: STAS domain-containing protein [Actinomadura]MBT2212593.1 STAS domain-containing protein [Actinomadura sp. NEAU-AAG7]